MISFSEQMSCILIYKYLPKLFLLKMQFAIVGTYTLYKFVIVDKYVLECNILTSISSSSIALKTLLHFISLISCPYT